MFSLHVHDSLSGCNSAMLSRSFEFCVQNQCTPGSLVKSDLLSLTFFTNLFSPQITELLGTQCFATVVAFAVFENLPTSTGRIFLLLNYQVGIILHSKGKGKVI